MRPWKAQQWLARWACACVVLTCLAGRAFLREAWAGQQAPQVRESDFVPCREIPVSLTAGTPDHPRLVEIEWIRIEPKSGEYWGVIARVGWSAAVDAGWRVSVDLLDSKGHVLRHPRDRTTTTFTCKAGSPGGADMHYADLDLGWKPARGRKHASQVRISLEPASDRTIDMVSAQPAEPSLQHKVIDGRDRKPLADAAVVVQACYLDRNRPSDVLLCATDAQGICQLLVSTLSSVHLSVQKDGYATMLHDWSRGSSSRAGPDSLAEPPEPYVVEMRPAQPVGGVVHDQDGRPIAGAAVELNAHSIEVGGMALINRTVQTDENGCWRVDGVPCETDYSIALQLKHPDYLSDDIESRHLRTKELVTGTGPQSTPSKR